MSIATATTTSKEGIFFLVPLHFLLAAILGLSMRWDWACAVTEQVLWWTNVLLCYKIITTQLCNELACGPGLPETAQHTITTVL